MKVSLFYCRVAQLMLHFFLYFVAPFSSGPIRKDVSPPTPTLFLLEVTAGANVLGDVGSFWRLGIAVCFPSVAVKIAAALPMQRRRQIDAGKVGYDKLLL